MIPEFYARNEQGIPAAWVARMRESMARLTPRFSADRTVREYTEQHYLPAAATYRERTTDKGAVGRKIVKWDRTLREMGRAPLWRRESSRRVQPSTASRQRYFSVTSIRTRCESSCMPMGLMGAPVRQEMTRVRELAVPDRGYAYVAQVPATRPVSDYTTRVIPHCEGVVIPLEEVRISWQP